MNIELRSARREDLPLLVRHLHALYRQQDRAFNLFHTERALLPLLQSDAQGRAWIVEAGGRPAGSIVLCFGYSLEAGGREACVEAFYIEQDLRGRGIGRGVLRRVIEEARVAGASLLRCRAAEPERTRRLFQAAGCEPESIGTVLSIRLGATRVAGG